MKKVLIVLSMFFCFSCNAQGKQKIRLKGTKWECKIAENCINIYEFKADNTFVFLSCEMEDEYFGYYYFEDGFLMLIEKGSIYDEDFSNVAMDKSKRKLYKIEINGDELKHLSVSDWVNERWIESSFEFDDNYIYKKLN